MSSKVGTDADVMELSNEELIEKVYDDLDPTSLHDFDEFLGLMGETGSGSCPMTNTIDFLGNNPGAIEAILAWIAEQITPEQRQNLEDKIPLDDSPDDEPEPSSPIGWASESPMLDGM